MTTNKKNTHTGPQNIEYIGGGRENTKKQKEKINFFIE